jgi:prepilin-type N-terminal cleavage/methylation domain-containing protein
MKKKAFTLVELLVVIAIIAMLLAILMPALSRVRSLAYQMICGTNQSGVGKAIVLYSSENDEKYPEFGPAGIAKRTKWFEWMSPYQWADPKTFDKKGGQASATVTSSLYLLVKYADVNPSQFICNAQGAVKFKLSDYEEHETYTQIGADAAKDVTECWDFGPSPPEHVSFSYNYPYADTSPDGSSGPSTPLTADISPWMRPKTRDIYTGTEFVPKETSGDLAPQIVNYSKKVNKSKFPLGNSPAHSLEGQNVLFNDMHVKFLKTPNVGVEQDNIYTYWNTTFAKSDPGRMRQEGFELTDFIIDYENKESCDECPQDEGDALLVQW